MDSFISRARVHARSRGGAVISHDASRVQSFMDDTLVKEMRAYLRDHNGDVPDPDTESPALSMPNLCAKPALQPLPQHVSRKAVTPAPVGGGDVAVVVKRAQTSLGGGAIVTRVNTSSENNTMAGAELPHSNLPPSNTLPHRALTWFSTSKVRGKPMFREPIPKSMQLDDIAENFQKTGVLSTATAMRNQFVLWTTRFRENVGSSNNTSVSSALGPSTAKKPTMPIHVWTKLLLSDMAHKTDGDSPHPLRLATCLWVIMRALSFCNIELTVLLEVLSAVYVGGIGTTDPAVLTKQDTPGFMERVSYFEELQRAKDIIQRQQKEIERVRREYSELERRTVCDVEPWKRATLAVHFNGWRNLLRENTFVKHIHSISHDKKMEFTKARSFLAWKNYSQMAQRARAEKRNHQYIESLKQQSRDAEKALKAAHDIEVTKLKHEIDELMERPRVTAEDAILDLEHRLEVQKKKIEVLQQENARLDTEMLRQKNIAYTTVKDADAALTAWDELTVFELGDRQRLGVRACEIVRCAADGSMMPPITRPPPLTAKDELPDSIHPSLVDRIAIVWSNMIIAFFPHQKRKAANMMSDWSDGVLYLYLLCYMFPHAKDHFMSLTEGTSALERIELVLGALVASELHMEVVGAERKARFRAVTSTNLIRGDRSANVRLILYLMRLYSVTHVAYAPAYDDLFSDTDDANSDTSSSRSPTVVHQFLMPPHPRELTLDNVNQIAVREFVMPAVRSVRSWERLLEVLQSDMDHSCARLYDRTEESVQPFVPDEDNLIAIVKEPTTAQSVHKLITDYGSLLRDVFRAYQPPGSSSSMLSLLEFVRFLMDAQSGMDKKLAFPRNKMDQTYAVTCGELSKPMPAPMFTLALVRLFFSSDFNPSAPNDTARFQQLHNFLSQQMMTKCNFNQWPEINALSVTTPMQTALQSVQKPLQILYQALSPIELTDWLKVLKDFDMTDSVLTRNDSTIIYQTVRNKLDAQTHLTLEEFQQAMFCVSLFRVPSPFLPLPTRFINFVSDKVLPAVRRRLPQVYIKITRAQGTADGGTVLGSPTAPSARMVQGGISLD